MNTADHDATGRQKADAPEQKFSVEIEVLSGLQQGVVVYDPQDCFLYCNQKMREFYPLIAPILVPGTSFHDILLYAIAHGQLVEVEDSADEWVSNRLANRRKDGHQFERMLLDGRVLSVVGKLLENGNLMEVHTDITRQFLAEQKLRNVIAGAEICTWEWNVKTQDHRVNEHWAALLGYRLEDLTPITFNTWRDKVHPDDLEKTEALFNNLLTDPHALYKAEYRLRHRNGHWIWVLDKGRTLHWDADGAPELITGVQFDISAQRARETALTEVTSELERVMSERAKVEQRLIDIAQVSDGWLWEMDSDRRFIFVLDGDYFDDGGVPKEGLLNKTQEEWLATHPDMLPGIDWSIVLDALANNQPFRDFVYRAPQSGDGMIRWRRMSGSPVFDANGTFTGFRGVGSDVTQLYMAKADAEAASRTKSKFLANMSHEIRTPLNGVLGMAELLESTLEHPDQKRMIGTIRRSGEALLNILNDILDMSKIEAGKIEFEELPFSPMDLAKRIEDQYELRANEKGLAFEVLIGSGAELLRVGDPHRVQQVLHNLVSNAIKFTDKGEVSVKIAGRANMPLIIEVRDNGIGMTPEQVLRLHDEFSQADSSVTRRFGGTGLGMAITQSLVERMSGTINVESERGKGTKITVTLPLPISTVAARRAKPTAVQAVDLAGLNLLAADDNQTNCAVLEMMLTRLGAKVTIVTDGAQAVQAWQAGGFDAVLLDIAMPVMDGPTALRKIREIEEKSGSCPVPIIAVTANVMAHQVAEYISWGFDSCIAKPISSIDLSLAIGALVISAPEPHGNRR
ncbi:hybrid sensor histidine kinase/response regulator [Cypionkella aquatica]|uniref:Sensory/regulatory protein RpfC n=1 Tax=Cypionkella aquatica TaxID=1756042 RepID=A0AA37TR39_9RHOB|nr:ATP-binding protein [Cypionkella aquatica]GLS86017.1 hybrid sensor histidine kinase/response regulator [Cypionkella aquatica]